MIVFEGIVHVTTRLLARFGKVPVLLFDTARDVTAGGKPTHASVVLGNSV
jgi:hypothetical protein